jgi:hypothetical protein
MVGNFAFTGEQRSVSYNCYHADVIPNSLTAVLCPTLSCEWVQFQNRPDSSGNITIGSERLSIIGKGRVLTPGNVSNWIPVKNLNLIWHKESDATTFLVYEVIGCEFGPGITPVTTPFFLLQEIGDHLTQEDDGKIIL